MSQQFIPINEFTSTLSSKGQVTIPIEIRKKLGLESNDKVSFIEQAGEIKLIQATYSDIASLQGAAGRLNKQLSWKKMKQIAYDDRFNEKNGK